MLEFPGKMPLTFLCSYNYDTRSFYFAVCLFILKLIFLAHKRKLTGVSDSRIFISYFFGISLVFIQLINFSHRDLNLNSVVSR